MKLGSPRTIKKIIGTLKGLQLQYIGRAADLLWAGFGALHDSPKSKSGKRAEWALHLQCSWRITRLSEIVVSVGDFYVAPNLEDEYNWDAGGESLFDMLCGKFMAELKKHPLHVIDITYDNAGGFSLLFERNYRLDVFPARSSLRNDEHWRLFQPDVNTDHYVFSKMKIRKARETRNRKFRK